MRKSGLQKQIASIFDDTPKPQAEDEIVSDGLQDTPSAQESEVTVQTMADTQAQSVHTPAVSTMRPKPLPKMKATAPKKKVGEDVIKQVKKLLYGASGSQMDPRQKKMTILVGVLAVVFAAVMFISMGGMGKSTVQAAEKKQAGQDSAQTQEFDVQQWQPPQALPKQLRNPMVPQATASTQTDSDSNSAGGAIVVKGIVFSPNNASAIINNKIVKQGEQIDGVTVLTITKDSVEFSKDGKTWTQKVQR